MMSAHTNEYYDGFDLDFDFDDDEKEEKKKGVPSK